MSVFLLTIAEYSMIERDCRPLLTCLIYNIQYQLETTFLVYNVTISSLFFNSNIYPFSNSLAITESVKWKKDDNS